MLLLRQLHRHPLLAGFAVFLELTKISFFGLEHSLGASAPLALRTTAGIDGFLPAWHSCGTLLGDGQECKPNEDKGKTDRLDHHGARIQKLSGHK